MTRLDFIMQLVAEYEADPNCRPELWISDADPSLTPDEKERFVSIVKDERAAKASIASYNSPDS